MSRFSRLITAVGVSILLAACGQGAGNPVEPAGPSLDGGILVTGGNRTESDSTSTSTTTTQTSDDEASSDSTSRGGILVTGGN